MLYIHITSKEKKSPEINDHEESTSTINLNDEILIIFHKNRNHDPYVLCTINSTSMSYETLSKIIVDLSKQFEDYYKQTQQNGQDYVEESEMLTQLNNSIYFDISLLMK